MPKHLLFLFYANGQAPTDAKIGFPILSEATNHYALNFKTEGYYWLLKRMVEEKIVDSVTVITESVNGMGYIRYSPGIEGFVVPQIKYAERFMRDDTIVWCRGGFRSWFNFLEDAGKRGHWLLCYAANTGRERWRFWDITFNDILGETFVDGIGRQNIDFRKPILPGIFYPQALPKIYDFCVGASNLHDKKGQWRIIDIYGFLVEKYDWFPKMVIPGATRKGTQTNTMLYQLAHNACFEGVKTGLFPRQELARLMNQSKLFLHLGRGGQGDRGVLEALSCGVPVVIGDKRYHSPLTYTNKEVSLLLSDLDNPEKCADEIFLFFSQINKVQDYKQQETAEWFDSQCGVETTIIPRMRKLFEVFEKYPTSNKQALYEHVVRTGL